jgi:hypothetical protein
MRKGIDNKLRHRHLRLFSFHATSNASSRSGSRQIFHFFDQFHFRISKQWRNAKPQVSKPPRKLFPILFLPSLISGKLLGDVAQFKQFRLLIK